jgi:hypothetical protein
MNNQIPGRLQNLSGFFIVCRIGVNAFLYLNVLIMSDTTKPEIKPKTKTECVVCTNYKRYRVKIAEMHYGYVLIKSPDLEKALSEAKDYVLNGHVRWIDYDIEIRHAECIDQPITN